MAIVDNVYYTISLLTQSFEPPTMGADRSISQAQSMAVLLAYAAYEQVDAHSLCRRRAPNWLAGI